MRVIFLTRICLTTDIDTLLTHMNNARFLRELDFAKIDFFERSDLFRLIRKHKGSICLGATTVRYRRYIKLFSLYKIISKIIYWDSQSIYMEHRFVTSCDDFVNAIVFCRTRIANCDVEALMSEALLVPENGDLEHAKREKPPLTPVLKKWIEHNELSSALLRSASKMEPQSGEAVTDVGAGKYAKEVNGNAKKLSKEIIDQTVMRPFDVIGCSNPTFSDPN
ncbi:hypothetical protein WA026_013965 [Henosepilachna vigintioctopunctata]|uniref:Protein THEM6 n=1 Tax=Henosepilachna vigintioctopunctata TaxID=420089 RepID=A0AAW1U9H7_9CUCU